MSEGQVGKKQAAKKKIDTLEGVVFSCAGSHIQPVYKRVYDKELDKNIVKQVDTFDIYEFIQASKSQTDLALLEKRFVELGELPNVDPSLGSNDFTNMPSNIHEVYDMANDIANNFAKLPKSIQDIFGTKEAYMKSLLDGSYQATLINAINQGSQPKPDEKVEESEGN